MLKPRGFRFYLPGSIGPGWLDDSTTVQSNKLPSIIVKNDVENDTITIEKDITKNSENPVPEVFSILRFHAQECPTLLRKGVLELFPSCLEVTAPQLTIITITQNKSKGNSRWSKETETEKLAQHVSIAKNIAIYKLNLLSII